MQPNCNTDAGGPSAGAPQAADPVRQDHRDLAIEHLAADEAALRERVRSLEEDCSAYRELLSVALAELHDVTRRTACRSEAYGRLVGEARELRQMVMLADGVHAEEPVA